MVPLVLASAFFLAGHLVLSSPAVRPNLVARMGEGPFRATYSVLAIVALVLLVLAWRGAPWIELWDLGTGVRHIVATVMPLAFILLVAGLGPRNPTSIAAGGAEHAAVNGVIRITRHPMMWGVGLWGVLHVLANGDLASLLLFGSIAALALIGARQLDLKLLRRDPGRWQPFMEATSFVPFAAIVQGRQPFGTALAEIGVLRIGIGLVAYAALLVLHPHLFGVPVFG